MGKCVHQGDLKIAFEREAWNQGRRRIGGIDEVGRGPLAGPVVAACVVVDRALLLEKIPSYFYEIDDSKKVASSKRTELAQRLRAQEGVEIGIGMVDSGTIDRINILQATRLAMRKALEQLAPSPDHLLIDGLKVPAMGVSQTALIQGDARSFSIAAASIVAKVFRDGLMEQYDQEFPNYGFARHKGYGTLQHLQNLRRFGPCDLHRRSFAPVQELYLPLES